MTAAEVGWEAVATGVTADSVAAGWVVAGVAGREDSAAAAMAAEEGWEAAGLGVMAGRAATG